MLGGLCGEKAHSLVARMLGGLCGEKAHSLVARMLGGLWLECWVVCAARKLTL
jgi:hypothetical protein